MQNSSTGKNTRALTSPKLGYGLWKDVSTSDYENNIKKSNYHEADTSWVINIQQSFRREKRISTQHTGLTSTVIRLASLKRWQ
jgi:hypothetical protein